MPKRKTKPRAEALRIDLGPDIRHRNGTATTETAADPDAPARTIHRARRVWAPDAMLRAGTISREQYEAAARYERDYTIAQGGSAEPLGVFVDRSVGPGGMGVARIDAQTRYRKANQAVGLVLSPVLSWCVLSTGTVTGYAQTRNWPVHRAVGYLCAALDRLAEHYGLQPV